MTPEGQSLRRSSRGLNRHERENYGGYSEGREALPTAPAASAREKKVQSAVETDLRENSRYHQDFDWGTPENSLSTKVARIAVIVRSGLGRGLPLFNQVWVHMS